MRKASVSILGVARNIKYIDIALKSIDTLASKFDNSKAIFVEGDSNDNTQLKLRQWVNQQPNNRTLLISNAINNQEDHHYFKGILPREGRISLARNIGLKELFTKEKSDYIIVIDMDLIGFDTNGIADSFSQSNWDVMCANGVVLNGIYRDTYAFRINGYDTNHHWVGDDHAKYNITDEQRITLRKKLQESQHNARIIMDNSNRPFYTISSSSPSLIRVDSCFGGLAIYKYEMFEECSYDYRHHEPPYMQDCEHVLLHECMRKKHNARIYSNMNMRLWYGHSPFDMSWEVLFKHFKNILAKGW